MDDLQEAAGKIKRLIRKTQDAKRQRRAERMVPYGHGTGHREPLPLMLDARFHLLRRAHEGRDEVEETQR